MFSGFLIWLGEAVVGLLPLLTHALISPYSNHEDTLLQEEFYAEMCILTVVISGLAVLSILPFGPHQRHAPFTAWTYLLVLTTMLSLIVGAIFYAVTSVKFGTHTAPTDTYMYLLIAAVGGSLGLSLERAILDSK